MKSFIRGTLFLALGTFAVAALGQDEPTVQSELHQDRHGIFFHSSAKGLHGKRARLDFRAKFKKSLRCALKREIRDENHVEVKERFLIDFLQMMIYREKSPGQCETPRTCQTNGFQPGEDEVYLVSDFKDLPLQSDECTERFDRGLRTVLHRCEIHNWPAKPYSFGDPYFGLAAEFADASYYYGQTPLPAEGIAFSLPFSFPFQMQGNLGLYFALKIDLDSKVRVKSPAGKESIDFDLAAFLFPPFATLYPSLEQVAVFSTPADDGSTYFAFDRVGGLQDVIVCWGGSRCYAVSP